MALLSEEVYVILNGRNVKYYEQLGYKINRRKDEYGRIRFKIGEYISVKVKDLPKGSHTPVKVKCDGCEKILNSIKYQDYLKGVKEDGVYFCTKCIKKFSVDKIKQSKLNNSKSFEQWCIENNRQDVLGRWDYELNNCKPSEIGFSSNKKYWFKCPKGFHESELKNINSFVQGHKGSIKCRQCNSFTQWGIDNIGEDFLDKYWDYEKNILNPWKISYGTKKKVWIKCKEKDFHDSYYVECVAFAKLNSRCPKCNQSKGEKRINSYLKNKIKYESQKMYNGLIGLGNGNLSYDFYLPEYNLLIEYQGVQHEHYVKGLHKSEEDFERQQEHDRRKKQYALDNNINLLEIWYWDYDNIEQILDKELKRKEGVYF